MGRKVRKFDINKYNEYVEKYKQLTINRNKTINYEELRLPEFNLPDARWLVANCPDKTVKDFSGFISWCGFCAKNIMSKEIAISLIYKMQNQLNRPLMYDDFRGHGCYKVPIPYITEYWGTMNKMKEELGLEIVQENMIDKQLSKEEIYIQVKQLSEFIKSEGRNFITTRDIDNSKTTVNCCTLRKMVKKYFKMSLVDYFKQFDIQMGNQGRGIVYDFGDGERTASQFEYIFSKYLRDYGFIYNKDYFRDVRYKDFITNYGNMMNCDYVIKNNDKTIYIEIAGIIEAYKTWYYEDKAITISKSKEKYRLKLKEKEQMLKDNNLIYFILFPCDLTRDIFMQIINNGSLELKHDIEKFMKNNIDWVKIQDVGELKYKENETSCYGNLVVDYQSEEAY